jgi:hypothetical protein
MTYIVTTSSPVGQFNTHDAAMQCVAELLKAGAFEVHVITRNGSMQENVQIFGQGYLK